MGGRREQAGDDPKRYFAFVESVSTAAPEQLNPRERVWLHLDAIEAKAFERSRGSIENVEDGLTLIRVLSTRNRLFNLNLFEWPKEGDWIELTLGELRDHPRAWTFRTERHLARDNVTNAYNFHNIPRDSEEGTSLRKFCSPSEQLMQGTVGVPIDFSRRDLSIVALDVGQAACVAFIADGECVGYFDVGRPLFFNQGSFPKSFQHEFAKSGFVVLSHWDYDHFALALEQPCLKSLEWYAPRQEVGPLARKFQSALSSHLHFISGPQSGSQFELRQGTGPSGDRNASGYTMRLDLPKRAVVLTGDVDYAWIEPAVKSGVNAIMIPHHCGMGSPPPRPGGGPSIAVASYGVPNAYKHPDQAQVTAHNGVGWQVRRTAAHLNKPRSDQILYP